MASKQTTIWIVSTWNKTQQPTLVSEQVTRTTKQVKFSSMSKHFNWARVKPIGEVHFTPEAALAAWRAECERNVEDTHAELKRLTALRDAKVRQ